MMAFLLLCWGVGTYAQPNCTITHYSSEDGLSQNSIMSMVQDHDGFLWFSTWNGINKFDGYDFKVYKARQENSLGLTNSRVDLLKVDKYNFIWLQTYDNRICRLDPRTERFEQIPAEDSGEELNYTSIETLDNGVVWLLSPTDGAMRVTTDPITKAWKSVSYATKRQSNLSGKVNGVFLDTHGQEWLLTSNGLLKITSDTPEGVAYFSHSKYADEEMGQAFYSVAHFGNELCFVSDKGRVWCYSIDQDTFRLWELPVKERVVSMNQLKDGQLLITTATQGLLLYHPHTDSYTSYNQQNTPAFPADAIRSVYIDREEEVWFEMTEWGKVCHFNPRTKQIKQVKMTVEPQGADRSYPAFHIHEDVNNNLWVHPQGGGLSWYNRAEGKLYPFYNDPTQPDWKFSNKVHSMMSDTQGNLWFCTHSKGLEKATFYENQFQLRTNSIRNLDLNATTVRALFQDEEGRVWLGKRDGRIEIYSSQFNYLGYLDENGSIATTGKPLAGVPYGIIQDRNGVIWIATKGRGIIRAQKQHSNHFKITRYEYNEDDVYSLSHNSTYWMHEDKNGRLWVATFGGGLNYIDPMPNGELRFISNRNRLKGYPIDKCYRARHITPDGDGNIWVGTSNGVISFKEDFQTPESIVFNYHAYLVGQPDALSSNNVYSMVATKKGELYLATFGGGLNKLVGVDETGKAHFKNFTTEQGLPSDILLSVEEDHEGNLWISTENGLSKFYPEKEQFENYTEQDLGMKMRFEEATSLYTSAQQILFGTSNGVLCFDPKTIRKYEYLPPVVFTGLKVYNQEVIPKATGSILQNSLNSTKKLTLSHKENVFTLSFAALDLLNPGNIKYAYYLEGFDTEWNYVNKQRTATYTNLPKGDYLLHVKSTNGAGIWVANERSLKITILPSFWETNIALAIYILAFCLLFLVVGYILSIIYRLKHKVSIEKQVSDIKLRFFTNISHELRTPLTLIAGPVEVVMQNQNLPADVREQLKVVARNTDRMLRLVNQILDFRKIQNKKMKMHVELIDVVPFVHRMMDNFELLAEEHRIDFVFESENPSLKLWVDSDKLEKIVFNLLSNAFKYTPHGKVIRLFIRENEQSVAIGVEDQGIGISEKKRASLFVRFESLLDKNIFYQQSSGIGLSLVKELVELHKAIIKVDSKEGEGSCFTVEFQKGREHYNSETEFILSDGVEYRVDEENRLVTTHTTNLLEEELDEELDQEGIVEERKSMLIVEDNVELRNFLRSIFAGQYQVIEATNGVEGLKKATQFLPDMIVSDVMMPEMDGVEMTKQLREGVATSHIPIVLLTAKSDMDSKLRGIEVGADDYITKPFSSTYLTVRVENLMAQRMHLRELYCANLMSIQPVEPQVEEEVVEEKPTLSPSDQRFMDKLTELMEQHMDNGDLIVDDLVKELAVSRSVFFKKLKTLTGLAPIEFIKEMRVKRAAQLIETGEFNMTQIAYMVGINDPRYFSKCFKQRYQMTPTEYKEKLKVK